MTWRIRSVILYQRNGKKTRQVEFEIHTLNVISGNSQTGKSAIIDIVNYCLMSKACPVPKGYVRRAVSHVGLHLVGAEDEFQVIRDLTQAESSRSIHIWENASSSGRAYAAGRVRLCGSASHRGADMTDWLPWGALLTATSLATLWALTRGREAGEDRRLARRILLIGGALTTLCYLLYILLGEAWLPYV